MCKWSIRPVKVQDLDGVTAVEAACFPPEEAATRQAFSHRIAQFPERFFVAESSGSIIGLINGCASNLPRIEDAMFETGGHIPSGCNQMIFGLAVLPAYRQKGVGAALLHQLIAFAAANQMSNVILTCKAHRVAYYSKFGFENKGQSRSVHGGAIWYDMVLPLKKT